MAALQVQGFCLIFAVSLALHYTTYGLLCLEIQGLFHYSVDIIYFQLFASMLMLIRDGSMAATGAHYGGDAEFIYTLWPSLKIIDSLYAIICFLLVIFAFYVRMSLA